MKKLFKKKILNRCKNLATIYPFFILALVGATLFFHFFSGEPQVVVTKNIEISHVQEPEAINRPSINDTQRVTLRYYIFRRNFKPNNIPHT